MVCLVPDMGLLFSLVHAEMEGFRSFFFLKI